MDMKNTNKIETISFIAAVLLIILFGYTAIMKLLEYDKFVFQMRLAPAPLMHTLAPILAWLLPLIELLIVCLLITGLFKDKWHHVGFLASFFLLLSFQIYIITMLLSGRELPCTCGGFVSTMSWTTHLWFNGSFMAVSITPVLLTQLQNYNITIIPPNIRRIKLRE
jgi:hypothetical protein